MRIRQLLLLTLLLCSLTAILPNAAMAEWPERVVKIVVTFPPGSANDSAARIFADALSRKWGRPVVVENRAGAEGTIGVGSFVSSQDDHALLYTVGGSISVAPHLVDKLPYDVDRDLQPIASATEIVLTLAVNGGLGVSSIPELIEVLKANPGKYVWASGPTLPRFVFAAFLKRRGLAMNYAAYRDAAQPQADLGEGRNPGFADFTYGLPVSGAGRQGALSGYHQPDPRGGASGRQDGSRTCLSRARNRRAFRLLWWQGNVR